MIATLITRLGDYLMNLSDGVRKLIVVGMLLVLGVGGIYKLIASLDKLSRPMPAASPQQIIGPMQELFRQSKDNAFNYHETRKWHMGSLDSLKVQFSKKSTNQP